MFDPLGLFAPVSLKGKIFIQHLWSIGIDWDTKLPARECEKWNKIVEDLRRVHMCTSPRCIAMNSDCARAYTLACFCDASQAAISTVVYVNETGMGQSDANLCFSKNDWLH